MTTPADTRAEGELVAQRLRKLAGEMSPSEQRWIVRDALDEAADLISSLTRQLARALEAEHNLLRRTHAAEGQLAEAQHPITIMRNTLEYIANDFPDTHIGKVAKTALEAAGLSPPHEGGP